MLTLDSELLARDVAEGLGHGLAEGTLGGLNR